MQLAAPNQPLSLSPLPRYEALFSPQPPPATCQFVSSVELALQRQASDTNGRVLRQAERVKAEGASPQACEEQLQEIERCIGVFLRENPEQGSLSLAGVLVSALCTLSRWELRGSGSRPGGWRVVEGLARLD